MAHDRALSSTWAVEPGRTPALADDEAGATPGVPGSRAETEAATAALRAEAAELQERLWAEHRRSLLLVIQAIDTGGKDGTIKHVLSGINPAGVTVASFKKPTEEELEHDFLWRIHAQAPGRGRITVFNRSHYEDVLVVRVHDLAPEAVWRPRYRHIRHFEELLADSGTSVVKVFLHISKEEQRERLQARLDDPEKTWKFAKGDLEERKHWDAYRAAFAEAIAETSTEQAPWHVVPADRKWYRNWAVATILVEALRAIDPRFPDPEDGLEGLVVE